MLKILRTYPKTDIVSAKSVLYQAYEQAYGIFNYENQDKMEAVATSPDQKRPLASVAMHFAEDHSSTSRLFQMWDLFADKRVGEVAKMSFSDFLQLPPELCEYILMKCTKVASKDDAEAAKAIAEMQRLLRQQQQP